MNTYEYDKDKIKESLDILQVKEIVAELGGEPILQNNILLCKTICHNGDSHKLYYYDNTHLFRCYTGCADPTFDIFELVRKVKSRELDNDYQLPQAIQFIAEYFGFAPVEHIEENNNLKQDLTYLNNYDRISNIEITNQIVELKAYDDRFLKNLPHPTIQPWIDDGISKEVMDYYEICYDPKSCGIVIPHRDINKRLIGVRERLLGLEDVEKYGKYRPLKLRNIMYNHPLSFSLYGLCQNQDNIKAFKKAIVFEAEKSVMQYATMFGQENNIAVAICGSSFILYQAWLLINLGVQEIIIALDKQYKEINDDEFKKLVKNIKAIHKKYGQYITISIIFDKGTLLDYKMSPTDKGKETFLELYKNRFNLYEGGIT